MLLKKRSYAGSVLSERKAKVPDRLSWMKPGKVAAMADKIKKAGTATKPLAPMAGGAPESCVEIDATEFAHARKDPAVRRLLERADQYAESLRSQGRLDS